MSVHEDWEARFAEAVRELLAAGEDEHDLVYLLRIVAANWRDEQADE